MALADAPDQLRRVFEDARARERETRRYVIELSPSFIGGQVCSSDMHANIFHGTGCFFFIASSFEWPFDREVGDHEDDLYKDQDRLSVQHHCNTISAVVHIFQQRLASSFCDFFTSNMKWIPIVILVLATATAQQRPVSWLITI